MTYDLRRLREHGLIARIPHTRRYQVTDTGLHTRCCSPTPTTTCSAPAWPSSPTPARPPHRRLRAAARAYQAAYDDLARQAHLAA